MNIIKSSPVREIRYLVSKFIIAITFNLIKHFKDQPQIKKEFK